MTEAKNVVKCQIIFDNIFLLFFGNSSVPPSNIWVLWIMFKKQMKAPTTNFDIYWIIQTKSCFLVCLYQIWTLWKMCLSIVTLIMALKSYKYRSNTSGNYLSQDLKQYKNKYNLFWKIVTYLFDRTVTLFSWYQGEW